MITCSHVQALGNPAQPKVIVVSVRGFGADLSEGVEELLPVMIIVEDALPMVAPVHDVINRPGIFDSKFASHQASMRRRDRLSTQVSNLRD